MSKALQKQIKFVFFDIDDTIFSRFGAGLAPGVEQAFVRLKQRGITPAIATGRARYIFPDALEGVIARVGLNCFVTINGQLNLFGEQPLSHYPFDPQEVARITAYFDGQGIAVGFAGPDRMAVTRITPTLSAALDPITRNYHVDPAYHRKSPVYQLVVFYDVSGDGPVAASGVLDGDRYRTVRWADGGVDLLDRRGSKIRGIHDVVRQHGLGLENVMVFGDSLNDIEMLANAGFGVAMGNGHPEAKRHADYIAGNADDDGVFHALLDLGLIDGD